MRSAWLPGLLLLVALGQGCDRNSNIGNPKDGLVDGKPDSALPREASADIRRSDGTARVGWAVSAGGAGYDDVWNLVVDGSGNIIIAGQIGNLASFGPHQITSAKGTGNFVAKLDGNGSFLWATPLDGGFDSTWSGLAVDATGNVFFGGFFTGTAVFGAVTLVSQGDKDGFVAKLDPDGKLLWAKAVAAGPGWDAVNSLAVAADGKITIAGHFAGTATVGGTSLTARDKESLFVARLDATGSLLWVSPVASDDYGATRDVARVLVDGAGNSVVAGTAGPNASFDALSAAGKAGSPTAFVAKVDPAGAFLWVTPLVESLADGPLGIDAAGNIFVGSTYRVPWPGTWNGVGQGTIRKLDASGALQWTRMIPGDGTTHINALRAESTGSVTFAGFVKGTGLFGSTVLQSKTANSDGYVARLDPSGNVVHAELVGSGAISAVVALARDASGDLYLGGAYTGGAFTAGSAVLPARGNWDIYVWNKGPEPY